MTNSTTVLLLLNISIKLALAAIAYYFYTVGDMFLAGVFIGWIIMELITILFIAVGTLVTLIWR